MHSAPIITMPRGTKIVATLGPATTSDEEITAIIHAGVDIVRLNFSHGAQAEHAHRVARVHAAAAALGRSVAILQDLQGPKIRVGDLRGGSPVHLIDGAILCITTEPIEGSVERV